MCRHWCGKIPIQMKDMAAHLGITVMGLILLIGVNDWRTTGYRVPLYALILCIEAGRVEGGDIGVSQV